MSLFLDNFLWISHSTCLSFWNYIHKIEIIRALVKFKHNEVYNLFSTLPYSE